MKILLVIAGLAVLAYWNYNRRLGVLLASRLYQQYSVLILIVGLGLCGLAGLFYGLE